MIGFRYDLLNAQTLPHLPRLQGTPGLQEFFAVYKQRLIDIFPPAAHRWTPKVTGRLSRAWTIESGVSDVNVRNDTFYARFVTYRLPSFAATRRPIRMAQAILDSIGPTAGARALAQFPPAPMVDLSGVRITGFTFDLLDKPGGVTGSDIRMELSFDITGTVPAGTMFQLFYKWSGFRWRVPNPDFGQVGQPRFLTGTKASPRPWTFWGSGTSGDALENPAYVLNTDLGPGTRLSNVRPITSSNLPVYPPMYHECTWRVRAALGESFGPWSQELQIPQPKIQLLEAAP